jgi:hypothetical protein
MAHHTHFKGNHALFMPWCAPAFLPTSRPSLPPTGLLGQSFFMPWYARPFPSESQASLPPFSTHIPTPTLTVTKPAASRHHSPLQPQPRVRVRVRVSNSCTSVPFTSRDPLFSLLAPTPTRPPSLPRCDMVWGTHLFRLYPEKIPLNSPTYPPMPYFVTPPPFAGAIWSGARTCLKPLRRTSHDPPSKRQV